MVMGSAPCLIIITTEIIQPIWLVAGNVHLGSLNGWVVLNVYLHHQPYIVDNYIALVFFSADNDKMGLN